MELANAQVSFLRLVTTRTRRSREGELQLAQFVAYGEDGIQLQLVDAQNPNGNNPPEQGPAFALDVCTHTECSMREQACQSAHTCQYAHTKWLDFNKGALECRIASGLTTITKYAIMTANDEPGRDPVRWVLEGRVEGGEWQVLDDKRTRDDQPVPSTRRAVHEVQVQVNVAASSGDESAVGQQAVAMNVSAVGQIDALTDTKAAIDEDTLRELRVASPALQQLWPDGEDEHSWEGITWSDGHAIILDLTDCIEFARLPFQIGQMQALTELWLQNCSNLVMLPPEIGQLHALKKFVLSGCGQLVALPAETGQLRALTELYLTNCSKLAMLPPEIGQLQALTKFVITGCKQLLVLPAEIGELITLEELHFSFCDQLILAPGAERGRPEIVTPTIIAAYAAPLIVKPHKDTPEQLYAFLLDAPLAVAPFFRSILTNATHATWLGEVIEATPLLWAHRRRWPPRH